MAIVVVVSPVIWRNRLKILFFNFIKQIILFDVELNDVDVYDGNRALECASYAPTGQRPPGKNVQVLSSCCDVGYAHVLSRAIGQQVQNE